MEVNKIDLRLASYHLSEQTLYIRPAKRYNAVTEIEEIYDTYHSMQSSFKIIDQACLRAGSSYIGRVDSMRELFKVKYNPPILIDEKRGLYAFATHSPHHEDCIWIITKNIIGIEHGYKYSIIHFKNNKSLRVSLSKQRMDRLCSFLYQYFLCFNQNELV